MSTETTTHDQEGPVTTVRGGRRKGTASARFTAQLVALVTPERKDRVIALGNAHNLSQAQVLRAVIDEGLAKVERGLTNGTIKPETLA